MKKGKKMLKATYPQFEASLFGAMFVAFALGMYFEKYLSGILVPVLLIGLVLHSYGMYMMYKGNKEI